MIRERQKRILVVDDEHEIRKIVKLTLESIEGKPYRVVIAADGKEALDVVEDFSPDLILLDILMPLMNGTDVLKRLRSNFKTSHIPIIFLTAKREVNEIVEGLSEGAVDYITKPFDTKELRARVESTLEKCTSWRTVSPLTGLPGNVAIEKETRMRLATDPEFSWIYVDIDNFKNYNDHYGFIQGDEVITFVAQLLVEALEKCGDGTDFVGHVGGDDFIIISAQDHVQPVTDYIIDGLRRESHRFFPESDRKRGFYQHTTRNNVGARIRTELCVTMAVVNNEKGKFTHPAQLSTIAAQVKEYGKNHEGSIVVPDRRRSQ